MACIRSLLDAFGLNFKNSLYDWSFFSMDEGVFIFIVVQLYVFFSLQSKAVISLHDFLFSMIIFYIIKYYFYITILEILDVEKL